jgi:hypothetical protein
MYGDPNQLAKIIKRAQLWYEETGEHTVVFWDGNRYDFTGADDKELKKYLLVLKIPEGFVN